MAFGFRGKFISTVFAISLHLTTVQISFLMIGTTSHPLFTQHNAVVKIAWDQILTSTVSSPVTLDKKPNLSIPFLRL